jgi:hypothetical protein
MEALAVDRVFFLMTYATRNRSKLLIVGKIFKALEILMTIGATEAILSMDRFNQRVLPDHQLFCIRHILKQRRIRMTAEAVIIAPGSCKRGKTNGEKTDEKQYRRGECPRG